MKVSTGWLRTWLVAALSAADVIVHMGARPEVPLAGLLGEKPGLA